MRCQFEALQPVRVNGRIVTGVFSAEYDDVIEALVDHGLVLPLFAPVEPVDTVCWEVDHCVV